MSRKAFAAAFLVSFVLLSFFVIFNMIFTPPPQSYIGFTIATLTLFLLVGAPRIRLNRLGLYLRENGLDGLARRNAFQTRDDHFFLDYSIGRWFRHTSFALAYLALLGMYFLGSFVMGLISFMISVPLLVTMFILTRKQAQAVLKPYDPGEVAMKIEALHRPASIKKLTATPPLALVSIAYLIGIRFLSPNLQVFLILLVAYVSVILYMRVIRSRVRPSQKLVGPARNT